MRRSGSQLSRKARLAVEPLEAREVPAFYLVTDIGDQSGLTPTAGKGTATNPYQVGSLRSAIELANASTRVADTIRFLPSLATDTITLCPQNDPLTFEKGARTTVDGEDLGIRVDGGGFYRFQRVFEVVKGGNAKITQLTIQNGIDTFPSEGGDSPAASPAGDLGGGGVRNAGTLTLDHVLVQGNTSFNAEEGGGGIYNAVGAKLTLAHSTVSGNSTFVPGSGYYYLVPGAGITNKGTMTITGTTVRDNHASGNGGGIYNLGSLTVASSTISENDTGEFRESFAAAAPSREGGDGGGGIYNGATLKLTNVTISGNVSGDTGGGILNADGAKLNLLNCTVARNVATWDGGGIQFESQSPGQTIRLRNTIVSDNGLFSEQPSNVSGPRSIPPTISAIPEPPAPAILASYCLIGTSDNVKFSGSGNLLNNDDPGLDDLKDNGGETQTMALLDMSAAINAGDPHTGGLTLLDQRGVPFFRIRDGRVDIGAYEVQVGSIGGPSSAVNKILADLDGQRRYH
jgi:hypothetical protein